MGHLERLRQPVERIVAGHAIRQALNRLLKIGPRVACAVGGNNGVELGKGSGIAEVDHGRGNFFQTMALIIQERNAMSHPMLSASWSVSSVLSTQSGMPSEAHCGAVAKSAKALLPTTAAAHHRERASPVLSPQRFPFIEHSL